MFRVVFNIFFVLCVARQSLLHLDCSSYPVFSDRAFLSRPSLLPVCFISPGLLPPYHTSVLHYALASAGGSGITWCSVTPSGVIARRCSASRSSTHFALLLLLLSGDIETNPGPAATVSYSPDEIVIHSPNSDHPPTAVVGSSLTRYISNVSTRLTLSALLWYPKVEAKSRT
jgi:hypothetical protein